MNEIYRILDANFNRAREALRVAEDCGRFVLNDPAVTAMAKNMRSELAAILEHMPAREMLVTRDTPGDVGTDLTSPTEMKRDSLEAVAIAACKRLSESLRTIEEYSKVVAAGQTLRIERMRYDAYTLEQRLVGRLFVGSRFLDVRLYVIVESRLCHGSVRDTVRAAIAGGADAIQVREKSIPDAQFLALAAELRELTDQTGKILIVNDRPDVAAMVGADGVHLGQQDLPLTESRRLLRPGGIVGRSTHSLEEAKAGANEGADYISVGPVYATNTKDAGRPVGPELVRSVASQVPLSIAAVGGIRADNVAPLIAAGVQCVAVSSAVCGADNPETAAQAIRKQFD
jgi:thiamine-phosphate pyrophosphorylase